MERAEEPRPELRFSHGEALILAERFDEARAIAESLEVEVFSNLLLGRIEYEQGDLGPALIHLRRANLLWPDNAVSR